MPPAVPKKAAAPKKVPAKATGKGGNDEEVETVITELFRLGDPDGSGVMEFAEFVQHHRNIMSATDIGRDEDDAEVEKKFRKHDTDNNQSLDKAEFSSYMKGLFSVIGKRQFLAICKVLIVETDQRIKAFRARFDRAVTERLLDQASSVGHYKPEYKQVALDFLDKKADPNQVDKTGSHCLLYAADKSDEVFIKKLLDFRADASIHNKDLECAAFRAAKVRDIDVLEVLMLPKNKALEDGAQAAREAAGQKLVRQMASLTGQAVKDLVKEKADPNFKDDNGWTPLTAAVFWGKQDCLEALLGLQTANSRVKLRLNKLNGKGFTPLHIAARKGRAELMAPILKARGDADILDSDGWTPLHHAAFNSNNDCVGMLVNGGANLLVLGTMGMTPYMCTRMKSRAGNLNDKMLALMEPSEGVNFGKAMLPILKDESMPIWDKLQALYALPGVHSNFRMLRIYDQCFDPRTGPNKTKLQRLWEVLALPLIRRLRLGDTDLEPPQANWSEDAIRERKMDIQQRQREQRVALEAWLWETRGPRPAEGTWEFENRSAYIEEMNQVVKEELEGFQKELDGIYEAIKAEEGGDALVKIPAEEVLKSRYTTQLGAHPIPSWVQLIDAAGAFEALRSVGVFGRAADDDECLSAFADLFTLNPEFDSGRDFWANSYRLWLSMYAKMANAEFQRRVSKVVEKFNTMYSEGDVQAASLKQVPPKSYDAVKHRERALGSLSSSDSFESRTRSAQCLDMVRCSVTVSSAAHAVALLDDFFRPLTIDADKLEVAKITNRFNAKGDTLIGYRDIVLNLFMDFGYAAGACGREGVTMQMALVGEVQIVLNSMLDVRKRRHMLFKFTKGVYDWPKDPLPSSEVKAMEAASTDDADWNAGG